MNQATAFTWSAFGDVVEPTNVMGIREKHFVLHACDAPMKRYYCAPCDVALANIGNIAMHLESGGQHHIAVWCSKHRVYEAPSAEQIEAFTQLQSTESPFHRGQLSV